MKNCVKKCSFDYKSHTILSNYIIRNALFTDGITNGLCLLVRNALVIKKMNITDGKPYLSVIYSIIRR